MILLLRVDHRLLHGHVAFSWTQTLGADCILIANDAVAVDDLRKTTMKLAKPQGVKLVIKDIKALFTASIMGFNLAVVVSVSLLYFLLSDFCLLIMIFLSF